MNLPRTPPRSARASARRPIGIAVTVVVLGLIAYGFGAALRLVSHRVGEYSGKGPDGFMAAAAALGQIGLNPRSGFPGKDRITICCMGIDDNWTNKDIVYTAGARTDTLFLLTLDLNTRKATMLSIPRDAFVPIAGTSRVTKINSAYSVGGPQRTESTIADWLGVQPDYYVVLNIDATKKLVDAIGGVDVTVEHPLNYDDNWGHLHVHLKPGPQHLNGDAAVGFARFRHGNHGITPEDGDQRRIYRQHLLMRAMMDRAKSFSTLLQANHLADVAMSSIHTDLSRVQVLDLASMFGRIQQADMVTAQIPGTDAKTSRGEWILQMDTNTARAYADWLVRGNAAAARSLTTVVVNNSTGQTGLARSAVDQLQAAGYTNARIDQTGAGRTAAPVTSVSDSGVAFKDAPSDIASVLGLPSVGFRNKPGTATRSGWTPPSAITVSLGMDYARLARKSAPMNSASL